MCEALTNRDALGVDQIVQRVLHQLRKVVREVLVADVMQVVVVRVLGHSPVEVGPGEDVL